MTWGHYILAFEKVGSDDGDKVVVRGFDGPTMSSWADSSRDLGSVAIDQLRRFEMSDGGCLIWSVLYDVHRATFEGFD